MGYVKIGKCEQIELRLCFLKIDQVVILVSIVALSYSDSEMTKWQIFLLYDDLIEYKFCSATFNRWVNVSNICEYTPADFLPFRSCPPFLP